MKLSKYNITLWPRWIDRKIELVIIYGMLILLFLSPIYWGQMEKGFLGLIFITIPLFTTVGLILLIIHFMTKSIDKMTVLLPWIGAILSLFFPIIVGVPHYVVMVYIFITGCIIFLFWKFKGFMIFVITSSFIVLIGYVIQTMILLSNKTLGIILPVYFSFWGILTSLVIYTGIKKISKKEG